METLIVVGTNHKYSPIEIRERLAFSKGRIEDALLRLVGGWVKAGAILSTCNRVELYASVEYEDRHRGIDSLRDFIYDYHHQILRDIEPYLYTYIGKEAVMHLFSVASGIDSQIIGEEQILEQVKIAFDEARGAGYVDAFLTDVFTAAIKTGERVRNETDIAKGDASIGRVVIKLIKEKLRNLKDKRILIIGVGKVSQLVTKYLKGDSMNATFVSNRTFEKAKRLAEAVGGIAVGFDRLKEKLGEADVVISATTSPHLILRKEDIQEIIGPKGLLIIDLAVPRDVEEEVKYIDGVELYCLDDLTHIIERNLDREGSLSKAAEIIEEEAQKICSKESLRLEAAQALLP